MKNEITAQELIQKLNLTPLPSEGGYYRETYRCDMPKVAAAAYGNDSQSTRNASTAILFLVIPESFSALHKVKSDEVFHFYGGDPSEMIQIHPDGRLERFVLGNRIHLGEIPQIVVPRGVWQALRLKPGGKWSLTGTTVAPGFEFEDFELGNRNQLLEQFPQHSEDIIRFSRELGEKAH